MRAIIALITFLFFLSSANSAFAATLFETGFEDGNIDSWSSSGGSASATASGEIVRSGSYAIKVQHDKTGSFGFQHAVSNIEGGMFYKVSGYGKTTNSNTSSFFIRLAWYTSTDGTGSQMSSPNDSNTGSSSDTDWVLLDQTVQAPSTANSVKIRLVLTSIASGQIASAYFDDVIFQESIAPTATPTNTPTPAPTSTPTHTPTPTKTPTASPTNSPTPTLTPKPLASSASAKILPTSVLGESAESDPAPKNVLISNETKKANINFQILSVFLGIIVFVVACGIVGFRIIKSKFAKDD